MSWFTDCWTRYNTELPVQDDVRLSPFQKWRIYRRPPFKFFCSILLVALTTALVVDIASTISPYLRAGAATWSSLLAPSGAASEQTGSRTVYYLYEIEPLRASLNQTVNSYFATLNTSLDYFDYAYASASASDSSSPPPPIRMEITRYSAGEQVFDLKSSYPGAETTGAVA